MAILTVSQINKYVSSVLKGDKNLQNVMIKGEISDFVRHFKTGHIYFTLKDSQCRIKAVMFAGFVSRLKFNPQNGMAVIISGSISVFERDGTYQIYVHDILPDGIGNSAVELELLKKKLDKDGLFDISNKRKLPSIPQKIGAVTSADGAGIRDIINVISRRFPICELVIINSLVQGENAVDSICKGIERAEQLECDVVIVARGGGSSEDLSAFNTEKVAYAIYNCNVPVVSAVGHEINFTIADFVADLRSPTPSAGAEMIVPDREELLKSFASGKSRLDNAFTSYIELNYGKLKLLDVKLELFSPKYRLDADKEKFNSLQKRFDNAMKSQFAYAKARLNQNIIKLDSLSPLKVMARGYSLVYKNSELINNAENLKKGDIVEIKFSNGKITAEILG